MKAVYGLPTTDGARSATTQSIQDEGIGRFKTT